jgi:NADH-quinone oxidoreductase subunit H
MGLGIWIWDLGLGIWDLNDSPWLVPFIAGFVVLNVVIVIVTYVTLLERKFAARMQSRIGPYRVGPHGLLQPSPMPSS